MVSDQSKVGMTQNRSKQEFHEILLPASAGTGLGLGLVVDSGSDAMMRSAKRAVPRRWSLRHSRQNTFTLARSALVP